MSYAESYDTKGRMENCFGGLRVLSEYIVTSGGVLELSSDEHNYFGLVPEVQTLVMRS